MDCVRSSVVIVSPDVIVLNDTAEDFDTSDNWLHSPLPIKVSLNLASYTIVNANSASLVQLNDIMPFRESSFLILKIPISVAQNKLLCH